MSVMSLRLPSLVATSVLAACGNVTSDAPADAAPDGVDVPADAEVDAPPAERCDRSKPFGEPMDVFPGDAATIRHSSLSHDGRTAYLSRIEAPALDEDVYVATRGGLDEAWSSATRINALSSADRDLRVAVSADERWAVVDRLPVEGDTTHPRGLYMASRASRSAPFGMPRELDDVNSASGQTDPYLSRDGRHLFFGRTSASGAVILHVASRETVDDRFGPATVAGGTAMGVSTSAWFTRDALTVYFHAVREGSVGSADLWRARRESLDDDFGEAEHLLTLSSPRIDFLGGLSPDECELYLTSDRTGVFRLYRAVRPR